MSEKLITATETALMLSVSEERVYQMARDGLIPVVRLGRQVRFEANRLQKWISSGGQSLSGGWRKDIQRAN